MALSEQQLNGAIGRVLRRFRSDLGLSQQAFADFLDLGSQTVVTNIETGKRPVHAFELWEWSERIAERHPLSASEIRREFFDSPFVLRLGEGEAHVESATSRSARGRWASGLLTQEPYRVNTDAA